MAAQPSSVPIAAGRAVAKAESLVAGVPHADVGRPKVILFANTDWYLFNFRLPLARYLDSKGFEVVLLCPPGAYVDSLRAAGFRVIVLDMNRRSLVPWAEAGVLRALWNVYRAERPDVVHHFTIKCVIYGSLVARLAGIRSRINAVAGLGYVFSNDGILTRMLRPFVTLLLRFALQGERARLIVQNHHDAQRFQSDGLVPAARIRLIRGSGVDTQRFVPCAERASGETRVLLATRLLWDKGVGEFVEAARLCRGRQIRFLLAGAPDEGNPSSVQRRHVEQWQAEGLVEVLGHVGDMTSLLRTVDIVALPTAYGEGVPRILLEAAAAGLPLIATHNPGCTEIVRHEATGLLVEARNARALADAIIRLHEQPETRAAMGHAARELATLEFDQHLVLRKTLEVYAEVIGMPPQREPGGAAHEAAAALAFDNDA